MGIEQRVELGETLGRRRQRRARSAADVADFLRAQQLDCREPGDRLLGRYRKTSPPQQRGKAEKMGDRPGGVGHACASVRMASIFGAMWTKSSSSLSTTPSERRK